MFRNDAVANGCGRAMPASCKFPHPDLFRCSVAPGLFRNGSSSLAPRHAVSDKFLHEIAPHPDGPSDGAAQQSTSAKCPSEVRFEKIPRARSRSYKTPTDSDRRGRHGLDFNLEPSACSKCCSSTSRAMRTAREVVTDAPCHLCSPVCRPMVAAYRNKGKSK